MSYPNIFLTRPWRRGIFYGLVVLFFVISPLVILYTAGYRYDWTTKRIQATGVLSIDVSPKNTSVRLGDSPISFTQAQTSFLTRDMASYELKNRAPGTYRLTLTNPGYHSWIKDISIQSNQTTYVRDVRLLPKTLPIKLTTLESEITGITVSASGRYILIIGKDDTLSTAHVYDTERETIEPLIRDQATISSFSSSPRGDEFALILSTTSSDRLLALSAAREFAPTTFTFSAEDRITHLQWPDAQSRDRVTLYFSNTSTLFALLDGEKQIRQKTPTNTWALDTNGALWTIERGELQRIVNDRVVERHPSPLETIDTIDLITDTHLLVSHGSELALISRTGGEEKIFRDVHDTFIKPENKKTYIASDSELWVIQPDGRFSLLNRLGSAIMSLSLLPRFSSIAVLTNNTIVLIREDDLVTTELFTGQHMQKLFMSDQGNHLTFLFSISGERSQVYTLPLIQ